MIKRLFDIVISFTGLLLFGSIIFLSWIAVSIDTKKNGFFRQQRIGQFGNPFRIIKLRTISDSNMNINQISILGRWMRSSKMDELPQLWNIFVGDMSFVGPRPDISGYYDLLEGEDRKILELKPGLTSLASIKYANEEEILFKQINPLLYNDEVVFPDKVKMNLDYYYNHSVFGDIKIIINTIFR
ncbi:sugar transferase [Flavobacterium ranwuense]|uniref:Sugar transferase n=1 Tax=Flavobacterium ranwuense TaxID=2541725 RepID=A0ABY2DQX8_9FLAO|nr:sugar transferase [Flavobacterium ranwuense]TDE29152.1 sugar transferase [Flavobacterium ranwuense]